MRGALLNVVQAVDQPSDNWAVYELLVTGTIRSGRNHFDAAIGLSEHLLNLTMEANQFGLTSVIAQSSLCYLWQLYNHQRCLESSRNTLLIMTTFEQRGLWQLGSVSELPTTPGYWNKHFDCYLLEMHRL